MAEDMSQDDITKILFKGDEDIRVSLYSFLKFISRVGLSERPAILGLICAASCDFYVI